MNPVYKFLIRQKTSNLLNPYLVRRVSEGLLGTDFMKVEGSRTYVMSDSEGVVVNMQNVFCYDANKELIWSSYSAVSSVQVPYNCVYLKVSFPIEWNPFEYGIFLYSFTAFEPYLAAEVFPIWKDLSIDWQKEGGYEFYRRQLNGRLTFVRDDYDFIDGKSFNTRFELDIYKQRNDTFEPYWSGVFYKTDCTFNLDDKTCVVTPEVNDDYTTILAGLEKSYDMLKFLLPINEVKYKKRPIFQFYVGGASTIGCYMQGIYWEQEANPESNAETLHNTYKFNLLKRYYRIEASGGVIDEMNMRYDGIYSGAITAGFVNKDFTFFGRDKYYSPNGYYLRGEIVNVNYQKYTIGEYEGNVFTPMYSWTGQSFLEILGSITLNPVSSGYSGTITITLRSMIDVFGRLISDYQRDLDPSDDYLPADDITDTSNYKFGYPLDNDDPQGYDFRRFISLYYWFQDNPSKWGKYYFEEDLVGYYHQDYSSYIPIARNSWDDVSVWMDISQWSTLPQSMNTYGAQDIMLRDAYKLSDVIIGLLRQIGSNVTFDETTEYSQFLYSLNKTADDGTLVNLFLTPKSNILKSQYDRPAQQAPITLKTIFDALRDMYRCYWFIEDGKLRIEHIRYFMYGKSYVKDSALVERDLTQEIVTRNGKAWAFGQNIVKYEKFAMPERYEFGWMDEVTEPFNGKPIIVLSDFVNLGSIEQITITDFTTDIDYMLANPSGCSSEGYALLGCDANQMVYMQAVGTNTNIFRQNGYLSFDFLQKYYFYDLPSPSYKIGEDGASETAKDEKRTKVQEVIFPCLNDIDIYKLIKTSIGNGQIEKLSINLSSRNGKATLKYNPYE